MHIRMAFFVVAVLLVVNVQTTADTCSEIKLPEQVRQQLSTAYPGWKIVTGGVLPYYDCDTWQHCCAKECPGIIRGQFTDDEQGYVVNLFRKARDKTFDQVIYFRPVRSGFDVITIAPSMPVGEIVVIRKGPPDTYRDGYSGRTIKAERDVILVENIGGGASAYCWDGRRFQRITTSI